MKITNSFTAKVTFFWYFFLFLFYTVGVYIILNEKRQSLSNCVVVWWLHQ